MILVAAALVVLLFTAGLAYWLFFSGTTFDPEKIKETRRMSLGSEALSVSFSNDGSLLASGTKGGAVELWTVATGEHAAQQVSGKLEGAINSVAFAHNANLLATGGSDFNVIIWDVDAGGKLKTKVPLRDEVNVVAFSPDDAILACGSKDGTVRFLDQNGQQQNIRLPHGSPVLALAFSADGKLVASGAEDGTVKVWETSTGGMKQQLSPKHEGPVLGIAFAKTTANANLLATAGADRKLILWELPGGQMKSPSPFLHTDQVSSVVFSPDDKFVLTGGGGRDTTIRFWKTDGSGGLPIVKVDHSGAISAVAVSSKGVVATGSFDKTVRLWATR
jgi:WD40 repeat protein